MKKTKKIRAITLALACVLTAGALSGCSKKDTDNDGRSETSETSEVRTDVGYRGTLPVSEGDVYAINKVSLPDELPAGYYLYAKTQQDQGLVYLNGVSQVVIRSHNYKENFQSVEVFAENACATLKLNNMYTHCDTDFGEPEKTKIAGFDAIRYDYTTTQNEFISQSEDDEEGVKTPVAWYKSRAYFFYSDKDVYYIMFTTSKDDWDNTVKGFEELMALLTINENAENDKEAEKAESERAESLSKAAEEAAELD